jgi:AP endonuclease-1
MDFCNRNVDGLRAWIKKGGLDFLNHEKPDVICLQEIKCSKDKLPDEVKVNSLIKPICF